MENAEVKAIINDFLGTLEGRIVPAEPGHPREFRLTVPGYSYFADFAFLIDGTSWLFVEDDEGQTAPYNASKYWRWIEQNNVTQPIHLVHIIGSGYESYEQMAEFLGGKITLEHSNFHYYLICADNWDTADWQDHFRSVVKSILAKKD